MIYQILPIEAQHNAQICQIIQQVGAQYGAVGEGFGPADTEVSCMSQHYMLEKRSQYLVAVLNGEVVGGGGIAPFMDYADTCELKKLFLLPAAQGLGIGKALTQACLDFAKEQGYLQCYLDTLSSMQAAIALYEKFGFKHLNQPLAGTIHGGCDVWMLKSL